MHGKARNGNAFDSLNAAWRKTMKKVSLFASLAMLLSLGAPAVAQDTQAPGDVPVFEIAQADSKITFHVDASTKIDGTFNKWDATLKFTSTDVTTG
jgi:hypothetical protein